MKMTYIAAEPEEVTMYRDMNGDVHDSRDVALIENVRIDCCAKIDKLMSVRPSLMHVERVAARELVFDFIKHNKSLVRVLIGDRDAT